MTGLTILVIGINYAPEPTGIAPYTTGLAEDLARRGAVVTVVTGMPHYPTWSVDPKYAKTLTTRECVNGVSLIRLRNAVPRRMTAARRMLYEATFLLHAALRTLNRAPDLVLCVSPALSGAIAGALVARRSRARLLVIVQDLMAAAVDQSGIPAGGSTSRLAELVESFALNAADLVLVISKEFMPRVERYGVPASRIRLARNWTHINPSSLSQEQARARLRWPIQPFTVLHTGNMGYKQDLDNVVQTARLLGLREDVRIVLMGDGSQRRALAADADGIVQLDCLPTVSDDDYPIALAAADLLLVNERPSMLEMSLPSKLTSYFAARRPILAAVNEGGAAWHELQASQAAVMVPAGRPENLLKAIDNLQQDLGLLRALSEAGADFAKSQLSQEGALQGISQHILALLRK
jgi:colanic acid biosynthesis glycosyl transferase WcaI